MEPRFYRVSCSDKAPLVQYIEQALIVCGCRMIHVPDPGIAPYRFTFEAPGGEKMGIMVYAFFANSKVTKNRPGDEHRFQVKYGSDDRMEHEIWQDPFGLYTSLFVGIDPVRGTFVGADPVLHNPTRFFKSIEYKEAHAEQIKSCKWYAWERDQRTVSDEPAEILVGGTAESFLRYVRFEREALGEAQGHRQLLAEKPHLWTPDLPKGIGAESLAPERTHLHKLAQEFQLGEKEVLDLISSARRLKMAVRGWVAEEHLTRQLKTVSGVEYCERLDIEGGADLNVIYRSVPLVVECKNVLRQLSSGGLARMDFQRTRASKNDPCSRYYSADDFDVLAACLHAVEERWTYKFAIPRSLETHARCPGKLSNHVRIDERWRLDAAAVLAEAASAKN